MKTLAEVEAEILIDEFRYTDDEWDQIASAFRRCSDPNVVRRYLEGVIGGLHIAQIEMRADVERSSHRDRTSDRAQRIAEALLSTLRSEDSLRSETSRLISELDALLQKRPLKQLFWLRRNSNRHNPYRERIIDRVLEAWLEVAGEEIAAKGGGVDSPVSQFLIDAVNPILKLSDAQISEEREAARKQVQRFQTTRGV